MKNLNFIGVFTAGSFLTLLLFQVYPTIFWFSVPEPELALWTAIGTNGAVLVALLLGIWGDWFKQFFFTANLKVPVSEVLINDQQYQPPLQKSDLDGPVWQPPTIIQPMVRLFFINEGNSTARDVEVYVTKIYDKGVLRKNFLPVPLPWTHDGKTIRNFHPKQFGYLDFCWAINAFNIGDYPKLILIAGNNVHNYEDIYTDQTNFELTIFQKSGKVKNILVSLKVIITNRIHFEITSVKEISK